MQHRITLAWAAKEFGLHHLLSMMKMLKQLRKWIFDQAERGVVAKHVEAFIREFFYQNPFSQVGLVTVKDGVAHCLTDLGGSPESHVKALMGKLECSGDSSLQNALDLVHGYLNQIPSYGHREMLILYSALSTCDPGDILETIQKCKKSKIRCSVIGLSAENSICKNLCQETGGLYYIPLDEEAKVGAGYTCPRCKARVCELPTECRICGLTLISSPHLARSYHHLFPIVPFYEMYLSLLIDQQNKFPRSCFGCQQSLLNPGNKPGLRVACPKCKQHFCLECDMYIHESLHNCPGCESTRHSKIPNINEG
ncbi:hypothetical protein PS2_006429 [Malus domestica]